MIELRSARIAAVMLFAAWALQAQQPSGGTIRGTVLDSASVPVANADVSARPGGHRTRTDSAGRFTVTGLDAGKYVVIARKVGYAPVSWEVTLGKSGSVDIKLRLDRRMPILDTVVVAAGRQCSERSFDGFTCRRKSGGGVFLDYDEIDEKQPTWTADIFRDIEGFNVEVRPTRNGPATVVIPVPRWGCIASLVDGRPTSGATLIPELPIDIMAVEVYAKPDSVPKEYQRYTWPNGDITRTGRCRVIVYWTTRARMTPRG
ncbi:MAG TPA: carboxypeptidase-like regulatory domain-containing protein [Gemmatimonadaceae bacterium]